VSSVSTSVEALLTSLQNLNRSGALSLVRPPQTPEAVSQALEQAGVATSSEVSDWYSVWDGQRPDGALGEMDVLPGFYALSLVDALAHRSHQAWLPSWLPLLADGGGDYIVVDTARSGAPVYRHRSDEPEPERLASSLLSFLDTAVAAFAEGVVFVEDGYLEQDEDQWRGLLANRG
jgi:cell wall assembly regulator SMI1